MVKTCVLNFLALSIAVSTLAQTVVPDSHSPTPAWKKGIKHIILLVMENRSFDNLMGAMTYTHDIDGVLKNQKCYPVNVTDPSNHQCVFPQPHDHNSVIQDPAHGSSDSFFELFGSYHEDLAAIESRKIKFDMRGYLTMQRMIHGNENVTAASDAINYYRPENIPTIAAIASNFTIFDRWFSGVPGPTNPNRAVVTSGTAAGHGSNDNAFTVFGLNQVSIFQQLSERNITWANYGDTGGVSDANFYNWTKVSGHDKTNVFPSTDFFTHLNNGNLSTFTFLNPSCCDVGSESMHPSGLISDGEAYLKEHYEALRASKYWEESAFIITFDESGGFGDHVPPVFAPRPDHLIYTETARDGSNYTLDYSFTGARVPTIIMSPWVPKGHVEHKGQNNGGEYTSASVLKFLNGLFDLADLTPRVTFSSTWEHIMLDKPRQDTPRTLPTPLNFTTG